MTLHPKNIGETPTAQIENMGMHPDVIQVVEDTNMEVKAVL